LLTAEKPARPFVVFYDDRDKPGGLLVKKGGPSGGGIGRFFARTEGNGFFI
jgi:hypothetical protein